MLQSGVPYIRTYVRTYGPPGDIDEATFIDKLCCGADGLTLETLKI